MAAGTQSAATPPDEPMDDIHRAILRTCRQKLVRDMDAELVLRNMADPHLFSEDDEDQIKTNRLTPRQKSETLLDILPTKGSKAYEIFKETIRKVHLPLHYTIVQAAKRHGKTSEEPTEPQSAEDILSEIRELKEYSQQKEKEELRRTLHQLKQMDQKLEEANKQLRDVEGKYKDAESRLKKKQEELKAVEAKGKDVENRLERKQEALKDVEGKCKDVENRLKERQEELKKVDVNAMNLEVRLERKQEVLKVVQAKSRNVGYRLEREQGELKDVEGKCKVVESRLKKKQEELKAVEAKGKDVENRLERKQEELRDVEGKYKDVESRLKKKQEELKTVEAKGKDVENRLERKQEELKTVEAKGMDLKNRLERQQGGISGSRPHEKPSKRMIFADFVSEEGASWILQKTGISIEFSPNAVQAPVMVTSSLWRPGAVSPPLEDNETLVSNIIDLACDEPVHIDFSKVTVALSHSATDLGGFEIVLKERVDSEKNVWKDLETWYPDPLGKNGTPGSELRFAKANITSFSIYAVISRLKSYTFSVPKEGPEFTYTFTEYPNVSVTLPSRSFLAVKDFAFTLKVQQVPSNYFAERDVLVSPVLHISCPVEFELKEPALLRMHVTLDQQQDESLNLPSSHIKVFYQSTRRESQEWVEITRKLEPPPKLEFGVVSFQVNQFSKYWVLVYMYQEKEERSRLLHYFPSPYVAQHVGFLACLCGTRRHENYQLLVCCFPNHLKVQVKNNITSSHDVVSLGEGTSLSPMRIGDRAAFHLPKTYTLLEKDNEKKYVKFIGFSPFENSVNVQVGSTDGSHLLKFVKHTPGQKKETQLCNVSIVPVPKRQVPPPKRLSSDGETGNIDELKKRTEPFTHYRLPEIKEDVGTCWEDVGQALGIDQSILDNLKDDCRTNRDRANAVLLRWMDKNGKDATVECLACTLIQIGHKRIAEKLLGM